MLELKNNGEMMDFHMPTRYHPTQADIDALKKAAIKLEELLKKHGVTEDDLLIDFRQAREADKEDN
ncbi:MAG: type II toxin-antitoxin system Phd/YefM family antitoxin [Gammaproteobacteria bacterium]